VSDPTQEPTGPPPTASTSEFIATFAGILAAIALLLLFDAGMANIDQKATSSRATNEYQVGESLNSQGKIREAADHFRTAASLDRDKPVYTVALAQAILKEGRATDAEQLLVPSLERNATDGGTNLAMARVLAKEGRVEEAKSYYHRAVYGLWPAEAHRNRVEARFELVDLLAQTGEKQDLLAELLPMQEESPSDTVMRKRIARLFVVAGSPARASDIFRDVLRHNPRDADAYVGLADAALALGNYPTAKADLAAAAHLAPDDTAIQSRMKLADSVIAIDPTQRGLGLDEQVRRSRNLVQMTIASARKCLGADAPQVAAALDSVTRSLVAPSGSIPRNQAIDENLSLAGALWRMRAERCAARAPQDDQVLALVQDRIGQ
jgi:tetratricopeptide (TPR) repeat protein